MTISTRLPLVSVVVPNYNHCRFLRQRLDSILTQDYENIEVILLDDASTDQSQPILREYSRKFGFSLYLNDENSGSAFRQWQKGVSIARGEYVWIAESDDFADSRFLNVLVDCLESDPSVVLAYCQSFLVGEDGRITGSAIDNATRTDRSRWERDFVTDGKNECTEHLSARNTIPNASAVVFRRCTFPDIADVANMRLAGDWVVWGRIIRQGNLAYIAAHLNYFRMHPTAVRLNVSAAAEEREFFAAIRENLFCAHLPQGRRLGLAIRLSTYWSSIINVKSHYTFKYLRMIAHVHWVAPVVLLYYMAMPYVLKPLRQLRRAWRTASNTSVVL